MKELGEARINIELEKGVITVRNSTDNSVLAEWIGSGYDWNRLWELIDKMENKE